MMYTSKDEKKMSLHIFLFFNFFFFNELLNNLINIILGLLILM